MSRAGAPGHLCCRSLLLGWGRNSREVSHTASLSCGRWPGLMGTFTVEADSQPHEPGHVEPEQSDDHEVERTWEVAD